MRQQSAPAHKRQRHFQSGTRGLRQNETIGNWNDLYNSDSNESSFDDNINHRVEICVAGMKCILDWIHRQPLTVSDRMISDAVKIIVNRSLELIHMLGMIEEKGNLANMLLELQ